MQQEWNGTTLPEATRKEITDLRRRILSLEESNAELVAALRRMVGVIGFLPSCMDEPDSPMAQARVALKKAGNNL